MRMDGAIFSVTYNCIEWASRIVVVRHNVSIIGTMRAIESVGTPRAAAKSPTDPLISLRFVKYMYTWCIIDAVLMAGMRLGRSEDYSTIFWVIPACYIMRYGVLFSAYPIAGYL